MNRLPIVGVMGSGTSSYLERAEPLGRWLAQQGVHLLTGGGGGVMTSVSRAFWETSHRAGLVIGVIPCEPAGPVTRPRKGYPNRWVEVPIFTHLPLSGERGREPMSRNHINVVSSNVIVALPGGPGTASEVALALEYGRPIIAFLSGRDEIPGLPKHVAIEPDFDKVKEFVLSKLPQQAQNPEGSIAPD